MINPGKQRGMNLIELMVSLTISLIILGGASIVLVNAHKTSRIQKGLISLQESARFAVQQISDDLQMAGYYGCVQTTDPTNASGPIINNLDSNNFLTSPITGYEHNISNPVSVLTAASRDVLEIQYANTSLGVMLDQDMVSLRSAIVVNDATGISVNDVLMIANCESGDIFTVSAVDGNALSHETNATSGLTLMPNNKNDSLSAWYPKESYSGTTTELFQFNRIKYYVANDAANNNMPTLFRAINGSIDDTGIAFISGVDAFEVLYGEDTDGDIIPNLFRSADSVTNWGNISAVRFAILLRTEEEFGSDFDRADSDGDVINVLGTNFDVDETRVRRRLFQTTVYIRNSI